MKIEYLAGNLFLWWFCLAKGKIKSTTLMQCQLFREHLLALTNASVSESSSSIGLIFFILPTIVFLTGVPGSMVVTWTTFSKAESTVEYDLLGGQLFDMTAKGDATLFVDSGTEKRMMYIHRVTLTGLKPATIYGGWSSPGLSERKNGLSRSVNTYRICPRPCEFQCTTAAAMQAGATCSPSRP